MLATSRSIGRGASLSASIAQTLAMGDAAVAQHARSLHHEGSRRLLAPSGVAASLTAHLAPTRPRGLRGRGGRCSLTARNTSRESAAACGTDLDPMPVLDRAHVRERTSSDIRRVSRISARSPGHITGRVLRDTRRRFLRERCPYAGGVPARGSACGTPTHLPAVGFSTDPSGGEIGCSDCDHRAPLRLFVHAKAALPPSGWLLKEDRRYA